MKIVLPGYDVPIMLPNGSMDPLWYEYFRGLTQVLGAASGAVVDGQFLSYSNGKWVLVPATTPANGETLLWDNAAKRWISGAN